ncbi:MAG: hypothetical protein AAFX92_01920 [Pseudomonadota bacterium]
MNSNPSNVDRLVAAGVLDSDSLSDEMWQALDSRLTSEEVDALISIKGKFNLQPWGFSGDGGFL